MVFSFSFLQNVTAVAQEKKYVVVLDAGHGGRMTLVILEMDIREKTIALKVVKNLGRYSKKRKRH